MQRAAREKKRFKTSGRNHGRPYVHSSDEKIKCPCSGVLITACCADILMRSVLDARKFLFRNIKIFCQIFPLRQQTVYFSIVGVVVGRIIHLSFDFVEQFFKLWILFLPLLSLYSRYRLLSFSSAVIFFRTMSTSGRSPI